MGAAIPIPGELDEAVTACSAKCHKKRAECGQAVGLEAACEMDKLIDLGPLGADEFGEVVDVLPIDMSLPATASIPRPAARGPFGHRRARLEPRSPRTRSPAPLTGPIQKLLRPASSDEP